MSRHLPKIGHWYQDEDTGQLFEIVALDADEGTIQAQYLDGEITDFDIEAWGLMALTPAAEPEDWRCAFELDSETAADSDAVAYPLQWGSPLSRIEPEAMLGIDDGY